MRYFEDIFSFKDYKMKENKISDKKTYASYHTTK